MEQNSFEVEKKLIELETYREHVDVINGNVEALQNNLSQTMRDISALTEKERNNTFEAFQEVNSKIEDVKHSVKDVPK